MTRAVENESGRREREKERKRKETTQLTHLCLPPKPLVYMAARIASYGVVLRGCCIDLSVWLPAISTVEKEVLILMDLHYIHILAKRSS